MIGKLVALLAATALICWQSSQIHRWHKQYEHEHIGRMTDRAAYEQAQKQAEAKNLAHVETENRLREQISEESHRDFVADRDRLRSQSGSAKGSANGSGVPGVPKAAPGTPPEVLPLPPAELLRAQELELQLNALIDWVNQQLGVSQPHGAPSTPERR
jgi:hypothetical protein